MLPTLEVLKEMSDIDIRTVDKETLIDLGTVEIDEKKSVNMRVQTYIEATHNPFLVRIGEYAVKFSYADDGETLDERMFTYVSQMAEIKC